MTLLPSRIRRRLVRSKLPYDLRSSTCGCESCSSPSCGSWRLLEHGWSPRRTTNARQSPPTCARKGRSCSGTLTPRELEILALMAEGRSNSAIATELTISERTVEAASAAMFRKLGLEPSADVNRRVL